MLTLVSKIRINNFLAWMVLALSIRLVCIFTTVHSDVFFVNFYPSKLAYEGVFNIYQHQYANIHAGGGIWTYYPPLTYFSIGGFQSIFKLFDSGFYQWIQEMYSGGADNLLLQGGATFSFFKYLFFMKAPYLIFDALLLFSILRYLDVDQHRASAVRLWCFSPVILFGTYVIGQFDIIPASLAVFSILMIKRNKVWWGLFLLSTAVFFKTFTVFMILPFFIVLTASKKEIFKNIVAIAVPVVLIFIPFYIYSRGLIMNSLFPPYSLESVSELSAFCMSIQRIIFVGLYCALIVKCFKLKKNLNATTVLKMSIATLMIVYTMFFVPVHYFIWVIPFLIIAVCCNILPRWLFWIQIICLFVYSFNSPGTTTGLFRPLNPELFINLPGLPDIMHGFSIRWGAIMLISRLFFTAVCVIIATDFIGITSFFSRQPARIGER